MKSKFRLPIGQDISFDTSAAIAKMTEKERNDMLSAYIPDHLSLPVSSLLVLGR